MPDCKYADFIENDLFFTGTAGAFAIALALCNPALAQDVTSATGTLEMEMSPRAFPFLLTFSGKSNKVNIRNYDQKENRP